MSLRYVYPDRLLVRAINTLPGVTIPIEHRDFQTIHEVVAAVFPQAGRPLLELLAKRFGVPPREAGDPERLLAYLDKHVIPLGPRGLSPGAMANPPDRLDGFHSYNLCCRSKEDTGRTAGNLRSYTADRRAYEHWCEGDWAAADFLMSQHVVGPCFRCPVTAKLTADHVGPISLGFAHRPRFHGLCQKCNSAKNNRMDLADIQALLRDESKGESVVSWQARPLWDAMKTHMKTDADALNLSRMLRVNQHHYLSLLADLRRAGHSDFLTTLVSFPDADAAYTIEGFDGRSFGYSRLVPQRRHATYAGSKRERAVRVAFEALDEYEAKEKRNVRLLTGSAIDARRAALFETAQRGNHIATRSAMVAYMGEVARGLMDKGIPRAHWG